jgi:hypothetical protein
MSFFYTKETIEKAKKIDLLTYLQNFEPDELVRFSRDTFCTKEHDSLKISNGKWYWFSRGFGGYNALDYLMKVKDLSFMEAMEKLVGTDDLIVTNNNNVKEQEKISRLILPEKNDNENKVIEYLMKRCIDLEIILDCINDDLIYETKENHNVVFVGKDFNNNPRYAGIRATNETRFMYDAAGSDKEFSFRILSEKKNEVLHIFESSIDLLSYATVLKMCNKNYKDENLIALAGVYQPSNDKEKTKIPLAVDSFLKKNRYIKRIFLHLDNDDAGRRATEYLKNILKTNYEVIDGKPFYGKDWNDFLKELINQNSKKKEKNTIESR